MKHVSALMNGFLSKIAEGDEEGAMASEHARSRENNDVSGVDKAKQRAKRSKKMLEQMRGRQTEETEDGETP